MREITVRLVFAVVLCLCGVSVASGDIANDAVKLPIYQTKYYIMHTDLPVPLAREAAIRMTRMAEEYHERTKAFSGVIRQRLPFYLFSKKEDYMLAGGMDKTAGVFTGDALMAVAGEAPTPYTWHTIQHEGFHQFVHAVIGGDMPIWMNEGLAEYFGESRFTGDSFVSGLVPPLRLQRVKARMPRPRDAGGFRKLTEIMVLTHAQWNLEMNGANYDQAWSMVQFLAHGDDGKYQAPFGAMMIELGRGKPWDVAWRDNFGSVNGFEDRWRAYWLGLPENPTDALLAKATVATLSSFLARAGAQKQTFGDFPAFLAAADGGKLEISDADWLPPALLQSAVGDVNERTQQGATFSIAGGEIATRGTVSTAGGPVSVAPSRMSTAAGAVKSKPIQVTCKMADGTRLTASTSYSREKATWETVMEQFDPPGRMNAPSMKP
jgi:hypothetical protein